MCIGCVSSVYRLCIGCVSSVYRLCIVGKTDTRICFVCVSSAGVCFSLGPHPPVNNFVRPRVQVAPLVCISVYVRLRERSGVVLFLRFCGWSPFRHVLSPEAEMWPSKAQFAKPIVRKHSTRTHVHTLLKSNSRKPKVEQQGQYHESEATKS